MSEHLWRVDPRSAHDDGADFRVDSHRRLRGPYTGMGTLLRELVPDVQSRWPDLVRSHSIEILSAAPELTEAIGAAPETLTSVAIPSERTRIYPANRTRRLAHGVVELLESYAALADRHLVLSFTNVDEADHTDQEFLAIAVRRARSGRVRFVVGTRTDAVVEELAEALRAHADREDVVNPPADGPVRPAEELVRAFVAGDCTSNDPHELAAYAEADPVVVAALQ